MRSVYPYTQIFYDALKTNRERADTRFFQAGIVPTGLRSPPPELHSPALPKSAAERVVRLGLDARGKCHLHRMRQPMRRFEMNRAAMKAIEQLELFFALASRLLVFSRPYIQTDASVLHRKERLLFPPRSVFRAALSSAHRDLNAPFQ